MKNTAKKLLCLVLVLAMSIPFAAFPAGAATAYADANDGDLLYTVNFNGDSTYAVGEAWAGMATKTVSGDGSSITLKPSKNSKNEAAGFGKELNTTNYPAKGNAYTMVFTVTASDADQEIGLYPDWSSGYVVVPGKNQFKYNKTLSDRSKNETIVDYTEYNGTGSLTQTYAIEYKLNNDFSAAEYSLYVVQDGEWVRLYSLSADELAAGPNWSTTDYETVIRFYRDSKIANQTSGTVTVSNVNVYKGLAVAGGYLETRAYYLASEGDLLYTANFNGDSTYAVGAAWGGMDTKTVLNGGKAIRLRPTKSNEAAGFGKEMDTTNYPAKGNAYTMVFTATASDADQEIGLYADWSSGFVVVPGKNQFKYNKTLSDRTKNETIVDYTEYEGTGSLVQTYAIEYKLNDDFSAAEYNLYVAQGGKWVLLYSLDADELAAGPNWSTTDYETVIRFYRDSKIANQTSGTVTVSNVNVYKGLAAKSGAAAAPADAIYRQYDAAAFGDAIFTADFTDAGILWTPKIAWNGMKEKNKTASSIALKANSSTSEESSAWGGDVASYTILGNSYTVVFTVTADNANQEIGFLPCDCSGFVVTPGQNAYKFIKTQSGGSTVTELTSGTYGSSSGVLTQTYAIEFKTSGTEEDPSIDAYNLYVVKNNEWDLVCSLNEELRDVDNFDWFYEEEGVYENDFALRFYRAKQTDAYVTVSDVTIYKGLGATTGVIPTTSTTLTYENAEDGDLLYEANFNGDGNWNVGASWAGMTTSVKNGGKSIVLTAQADANGKNRGNAWGKHLNLSKYPAGGNSYTVVFTVEASDADEEIGFYPDWSTGFLLTPGQNKFRYLATEDEGVSNKIVVASATYEGSGALKQTYAVDFTVDEDYNATGYHLYVLQDGVWVCIYSLSANQMAQTSWGGSSEDYEVALRFFRHYYVIDESGKSTSTVDETQSGTVTVSDLKVYRGADIFPELGAVTGASVRLSEPTGIRFTGSVNKTYFDALKAQYGAENVKIGMLITPRDYLVNNGVAFTKEALDACDAISGAKYLEIDAVTVLDEGTHYKVNCAMVNVREANYNRVFSARLYVKVNGEIYQYASYSATNNARSIAAVAEAAYNDVKAAADSIYKYETTLSIGTTVYSPYQNREILKDFFEEAGLSISVMTYNIRTYGDADNIWDQITGNYEGWAGREVAYALETITELMPDVIGLQEDDENLYNEYKNVPALEQNYERLNAGGNGNEGNEILYKKGIFTLIDTGTEYYKELAQLYADDENIANADFSADTKGDNGAGRFFRWAILEKDGVQFLVVNTHLHYKASNSSSVSDAVNKNLRKAQATLIRRWLNDSEEASGCVNRIVMGDMNAQGDSQEMKWGYLNGDGALARAKDNAVCLGDVGGTLISEGFEERQPWVYDHIFYNADALVAYEFSVVDNFDAAPAPTNYPSDHLPVIAKFICK